MFNIVTPYIKFGDGDKEYMFWDEDGTYSLDDDEKTYTFRNLITMLYETHNELPSEALFFLPSIPSEVSLKSYSGNITVEYGVVARIGRVVNFIYHLFPFHTQPEYEDQS